MSSQILDRIRRNHALEHATINVLSQKFKGFSAQGNSTPGGFNLNIYGDIERESVIAAVDEAYDRLQKGESKLALHPNCGTVLLTTATMAAVAAQATLSLERRRQNHPTYNLPMLIAALPLTILAIFVAIIVSKPVGMTVQEKYTVDPDLGDLKVVNVRPVTPFIATRIFQLLLGQAKNDDVNAYRIDTIG